MENLKNAAEVKAAANKKPYIKPDFEVINLEDTQILLAGSGNAGASGSATQFRTLGTGRWD